MSSCILRRRRHRTTRHCARTQADVASATSLHTCTVDKLWRFSNRSSGGDGTRIPQKRSRTALPASLLTCSVFRSCDGVRASRSIRARRHPAALDVKIFHAGSACAFRRTDHRWHGARTRIRLTLHVSLVLSARPPSDERLERGASIPRTGDAFFTSVAQRSEHHVRMHLARLQRHEQASRDASGRIRHVIGSRVRVQVCFMTRVQCIARRGRT
jgi:hypothetical protein